MAFSHVHNENIMSHIFDFVFYNTMSQATQQCPDSHFLSPMQVLTKLNGLYFNYLSTRSKARGPSAFRVCPNPFFASLMADKAVHTHIAQMNCTYPFN